MKNLGKILFLILFSILVFSCKKDVTPAKPNCSSILPGHKNPGCIEDTIHQ